MRTAHRMAKHSFSTVLYLVSLFESFRLRYSTGRSSPSTTWARTAPSPLSDASVCNKKGRSKLGECRSGPPHRAAFTLVRACWHSSVHWTGSGASFLVRSVSGLVRSEKLGTRGRPICVFQGRYRYRLLQIK